MGWVWLGRGRSSSVSIVGQRETVTRERHRKMKAERTTEKDRTRFKTMKKYTWFVERETERDSDAIKRKAWF